jgi:hypothetical protein
MSKKQAVNIVAFVKQMNCGNPVLFGRQFPIFNVISFIHQKKHNVCRLQSYGFHFNYRINFQVAHRRYIVHFNF